MPLNKWGFSAFLSSKYEETHTSGTSINYSGWNELHLDVDVVDDDDNEDGYGIKIISKQPVANFKDSNGNDSDDDDADDNNDAMWPDETESLITS